MTIVEFHDTVNLLLNKTQSGFFPPEEIDLMADRAQNSIYGTYYAEYLESNYIHQALNPFRKIMQYTSANFSTGGYLDLPTDYVYPTGMYIQGFNNKTQMPTYQKVRFYKDDELPDALASRVRPVDANHPICVVHGSTQLRLYPNVITYAGNLHYLRKPAVPKYNYALSGRNPVYTPTGSQDLEWQDPYINSIILKTLEFLGVNLNDPEISQWAASKNASTQTPDKP